MMIEMEIGTDFEKVAHQLGELGKAIAEAASQGMAEGMQVIAGEIGEDLMRGKGLKSRTGMLAKNITSWMTHPFQGTVGVPENTPVERYKWLLGDEQKTITPTKSKFLTIPIGENLSPSGVPKFSSPRQVQDGFFLKGKSGGLFFGWKQGKRGKFRPLFVLKKSVLVQGSGALIDGVMEKIDTVPETMEKRIGEIDGVDVG
jgi:hypothetical protein